MSWFSCEWRFLAHLVYPVPAEDLRPLLPAGLVPDPFDGTTYVAVTAAQCRKPKWRGIPVLGPEGFSRVRWQTYVRSGGRRGVFPLSEIYSMQALATLLGGKYSPIHTAVEFNPGESGSEGKVLYRWGQGAELRIETEGPPVPAEMWPEEQFFVDSRFHFGPKRASKAERGTWFVWEAQGSALTEAASRELAGERAAWISGKPAFHYLAKGGPVAFNKAKLT